MCVFIIFLVCIHSAATPLCGLVIIEQWRSFFPSSDQPPSGLDTLAVVLFEITTPILINSHPHYYTYILFILYLNRQFDALHCIWVGRACSVYLMFWDGHSMH